MPKIYSGGHFESTLIISPPGRGKTTVLRDLVRTLSDDGLRVSVADERGEIAAMRDGAPQMDVGRYTDVIDNCPKDKAVMMLLRAMNPQIIAMDEITATEDALALMSAEGCGVGLLATVHANSLGDLMNKGLYRSIIKKKLFKKLVTIENVADSRTYSVSELEGSVC